jgi:Ribonuclease G/E
MMAAMLDGMNGGDQVVLGRLAGREAAALLRAGQLHDLLLDTPDATPRPGAIYRALVDRPMKGMGGAMLRLPDGTGFLRQGAGLRPGSALLVQVSGHAEAGKAVPVTPRLLFKGRHAIVTPDAPGLNIARAIRDEDARQRLTAIAAGLAVPEGIGLILRSAAETAEDADIVDEVEALLAAAQSVLADPGQGPELLLDGPSPELQAWRDWPSAALVAGGFDAHGVAEALAALAGPEPLAGGGRMHVQPTRAFVAVDVDTGGDTSPAAGLKANIAALRALPRRLRLLGLGGQIVIDPAPTPKKQRPQLEQALRAALRDDPVETSLVGWTPLGHMELQRKRERTPVPLARARREEPAG